MGDEYIVSCTVGVVHEVYFYTNDKEYHFLLGIEPLTGKNENLVVLMEDYIIRDMLYHKVLNNRVNFCILPLRGGAYLFINGDKVYDLKSLSRKYGNPYNTLKKMKEVLLNE